jgi:anti-anti-sigma regulatory factor
VTAKVTAQDGADGLRVVINGAITEATDFSLVTNAQAPRMVIDLAAVERVNSYGVREWINVMRVLAQRNVAVRLEPVSVVMVRQMNMIPQVRGGATVGAVLAPYFCTACDDERSVLLASDLRAAPESAPCPTCGAAMELDDVADAYFAFRREPAGGA